MTGDIPNTGTGSTVTGLTTTKVTTLWRVIFTDFILQYVMTTGAALGGNNLPPKMAAAFQGLITNAGLMAAGMSYSYSSQKQTTSLYLYI